MIKDFKDFWMVVNNEGAPQLNKQDYSAHFNTEKEAEDVAETLASNKKNKFYCVVKCIKYFYPIVSIAVYSTTVSKENKTEYTQCWSCNTAISVNSTCCPSCDARVKTTLTE